MNFLHSYWRMEYIENLDASKKDKNLFANLPNSGNDRKALIIYRATHSYLVLNKFPYNAGHLLAVPYREVADLSELTDEERTDLMASIIKAKEILQQTLSPDGFNIGFNLGKAAGAGIEQHLHCHIVPRWEGDTNFMPVIGSTRVLPTALDNMWQRLHDCVQNT